MIINREEERLRRCFRQGYSNIFDDCHTWCPVVAHPVSSWCFRKLWVFGRSSGGCSRYLSCRINHLLPFQMSFIFKAFHIFLHQARLVWWQILFPPLAKHHYFQGMWPMVDFKSFLSSQVTPYLLGTSQAHATSAALRY